MIRNLIRYGALAGIAVSLGACDLDVKNPNDPGTAEVLATPADAENLLGSYWRRWNDGLYRGIGSIWGMTSVQAFAHYSSLANNCQNTRAGIPRPANDNSISNICQGEQQRVYFVENEVTRVATNIMKQLNSEGFTLGSKAQDERAKAFGEFLRGLSMGYVAMLYDSGAVVTEEMAGDDPGTLVGYRELMDSALAALDRAITHTQASAAEATGEGFPIPQAWIPTETNLNATNFEALVRSYRARFRANVARNAAEVTAADWAAIIADAEAGITSKLNGNHTIITNTVSGPFKSWVAQWQTRGLWHQMTPFIIGMADQSGAYKAWIEQSLSERGSDQPFFMVTADLRFPQGISRADQQADMTLSSCEAAATPCERYFINRPSGDDQNAGLGWGLSNYDFVKYRSWSISGDDGNAANGSIDFITKAEMDLLAAEGYIRGGAVDYTKAANLINNTRTAGMVGGVATGGGLAAVSAAANGGAALSSTGDCIPLVPSTTPNGSGTVTCAGDLPGDRGIMEAMKYEKRLETLQSHFAAWFLDSRRWGDLAEGTPLHWAVPYQDLQARQKLIYSTGLNAAPGSAAPASTYGW